MPKKIYQAISKAIKYLQAEGIDIPPELLPVDDTAKKAELLSASISVAMNTTAFGLIVAIPLLLLHSVLQSKTTQIVDSLEMASVKFLNTVVERRPEAA